MSAILKPLPTFPAAMIETVTPSMARQWLAANTNNRPVNQGRVICYAEEMEANRWVVNGETIKFTGDGRLIDGQHRLMACDLAAVPFTTYVVRGVNDPKAFATVDVGEIRTAGDIFHISGFKDQTNTAATATLLWHYERNSITTTAIGKTRKDRFLPKDVLLEFAAPQKFIIESAVAWARACDASKFVSPSTIAFLLILFARKSKEQAEKFFVDLGEGVGLSKTDPVYRLRERLIVNSAAKEKLTRPAIITLTITAWNKRRAGEQIKNLVMPEKFPKVK